MEEKEKIDATGTNYETVDQKDIYEKYDENENMNNCKNEEDSEIDNSIDL